MDGFYGTRSYSTSLTPSEQFPVAHLCESQIKLLQTKSGWFLPFTLPFGFLLAWSGSFCLPSTRGISVIPIPWRQIKSPAVATSNQSFPRATGGSLFFARIVISRRDCLLSNWVGVITRCLSFGCLSLLVHKTHNVSERSSMELKVYCHMIWEAQRQIIISKISEFVPWLFHCLFRDLTSQKNSPSGRRRIRWDCLRMGIESNTFGAGGLTITRKFCV